MHYYNNMLSRKKPLFRAVVVDVFATHISILHFRQLAYDQTLAVVTHVTYGRTDLTVILTLVFIKTAVKCSLKYFILKVPGLRSKKFTLYLYEKINFNFKAYHKCESLLHKWTAISVQLEFKWEFVFQNEQPIWRWHSSQSLQRFCVVLL